MVVEDQGHVVASVPVKLGAHIISKIVQEFGRPTL